ncbi:fasciclin domain-containing protein [Fodinibius sp.]|uniref:fasciclin domain-containing protein n=1 Tax=Fodinibius sp. TaxID=1872440 RepID=UPI002ACD3675|nr:fasciclin domain-containing protein [Fodinibius sp.]MDZ7660613.1 fasciclin domain-containing protein [Fodinibius sp.]
METTTHNPLIKLRTFLFNSFIAVLLVFTLQACGGDDDGPTDPPNETGNIVEVAQSNDDFSDLVSALSDAGLVSTLEGDGPFTVFAPTNSAFSNLDVDISALSNEQLEEVLSYHVVSGNIASGDLNPPQTAEALAGGNLFITSAEGNVIVNDNATVVDPDIEASNGVIHAIDQVLLPDGYLDVVGIVAKRYNLQSLEDAVVGAGLASTLQDDEASYTVFAPSNAAFSEVDLSGLSEQEIQDILTYHVLPNEVLSGDLQPAQVVQTVNGTELTIEAADGTVTLTDNSGQTYEVTQADIQGTNGVVHIIDGVLNPNPNIVDVASDAGNFTTLVDALGQTGLDEALQGAGPFTVFAPNDNAFSGVDLSGFTNEELTEILQYHVVSGNIQSTDLMAEQSVEALSGDSLFVEANGGVSVNGSASVVTPDIGASNGTIHEIDQVLLPDSYQDVVGIISKRYNLQSLEDAVVSEGLAGTLQGDGPFTVFAPTNEAFANKDLSGLNVSDVLQYHVISGEVLSGDLQSSQTVTTLQGEELLIEVSDGTVTITDNTGQMYQVTQADLQGTNGVVHVINGVLDPSPNIVDVATNAGNFTTLVDALGQTGLDEALQGAGPFTVFAPTDNAFSGVDLSGFTNEQLAEILQYHVISGDILSTDLMAEQSVGALAGGNLFIEANGGVTVNDNATVVSADIDASNGTIHAIDQVLLPDAYQDVVGIISKRYNLQSLEDAVVNAGLAGTLQGDGPFTVFAPTNDAFANADLSGYNVEDVLTYHVLPQEVLSSDITSGTVTTVNGADLEITVNNDGSVSLTDQAGNTYNVTTVDLQGTNGVVHIIDGVLLPS